MNDEIKNNPTYRFYDNKDNIFVVKMVPKLENVWASYCGRIFRIDLHTLRFKEVRYNTKRKNPQAKILTPEASKSICVHRMIASAWLLNPENKATVNHKNFKKDDNSVPNLEWMTPEENNQHANEKHPKHTNFQNYRDWCNGIGNFDPNK